MHGKTSQIEHENAGVFGGLPSPFTATRYHSLVVEPETLPKELQITARTGDEIIMGLRHRAHPVWGLQFHPESIASEQGTALAQNFMKEAAAHHV